MKIGDWIDEHLKSEKEAIEHYPEDRNMEFLKLDKKVYIPTCDKDGNTSWGEMTAITRHDPGDNLYKFTTKGGRTVVVADSESMLIWNKKENIFEKKQSKDIKLNEYVPVIASLPEPPIINTYVDMIEYFPKSEYIYGTECFKAEDCIKIALKDRKNLPRNWWKDNNGKKFTLPYKRSGYLKVALERENNNIKEGYLYINGTRAECLIPDKFELNNENGIFIGLYLAEGSTRNPQQVSIANTDRNIKDFAIKWFNKYNIHNLEENYEAIDEITKKKRISENIVGNSTLLASFLNKTIRSGAKNKIVPSFAYNAPEEFVIGLLNGYFSGDGSVDTCRIRASSISEKLIEGISMLCSRIGVFGQIYVNKRKIKNDKIINPEYVLAIYSQWANIFSKKVDLILEYKNDKLKKLQNTRLHRNYPHHNDVVKDEIINIELLSKHNEIKLYDVTVPSTLNFSLANGLNIVDTSETGYLQRKLVKAMEDCKINYDFTVRNASGSIIQFLYGEDGMDASKIENQPLIYIEKDFEKLKREYLLTSEDDLKYYLNDATLKEFKSNKDWEDKFMEHFKRVVSDREYLITKVFQNKKETALLYPISFMRLINNAKAMFKDTGMSDLNPMKVLTTIENLTEELFISNANKGNMILAMLLRCYLSPKKVTFEYKFSESTFDYIIQQVKMKFYDAIAHPAEMVGVIAAQSIGEPCTQMSIYRQAHVLLKKGDEFYSGPIGDLLDSILEKNKDKVITIGKDSVVLDLIENCEIIGVSNEEKTSWKKISQISRHPANGGMVKVTTMSGKTTTATLSHSFLKRTEKGIDPILGSDLKVGDRIPVAKNIPEHEESLFFKKINDFGEVPLSRDFGWLCGVYMADESSNTSGDIRITKIIPEYCDKVKEVVGMIFEIPVKYTETEQAGTFPAPYNNKTYKKGESRFSSVILAKFFKENFGENSHKKSIPGWVFFSNKEFIAGFLGGYYDGDGNVNCQMGKQMIRNGSVSERLTSDVIILLSYVGIFASKCVENPKCIKVPFHTIQISKKYAQKFKDEIGFVVKEKADNLDKIIEFMNKDKKHDEKEYIDKIPELGNVIADIGSALKLPSSSYSRWKKKESIGRNTLIKYINIFEQENIVKKNTKVTDKLEILRQAAYSDVVWDEIIDLEYLDDPEEYVYDFTVPGNDSFMVDTGILVHNTLNSVEWNTPMLFSIDNKLKEVSIGEFIDNIIKVAPKEHTENHANDTILTWIKEMDVKVLSSDTSGKITWEKVEAVTKHPPINKDGSNTLLKVTTRSGRQVTATKAKSFLKRVNNEIIQVNGDEIKVGDFLPVSKILPISDDMINEHIDISQIIPNEDWLIENDIVQNIVTKQFGELSLHRDKIKEYITKSKYDEDKLVFENILKEQIFYDEIITIKEVLSEYPYVYDLTVENTRNFNIYNGLAMADTFHLSGVSSASRAVRGVPRIKELLSVTRNIKTPALTIHLKEDFKKDKMKAKEVLNTIQTTYFADIVKSTKIYYDPDDFNTTIEDDKFFLESYKEFIDQEMISLDNLSPWLLRLEFDKDKMLEYDISMMEIYNALQEFYEDNVSVMFSDDNAQKLVFRIKIHEIDDKHEDIMTDLKALEKNILENLIVKGVRKINKVVMNKNEYFEYNPDTLTFEKTAEWVLDTSGTNMIDILSHRNVDGARTISNDINEIYETLGIEAARQALFNEISDVIKYADLYVNYRHLALLVDTMTTKGYLLSIDRHGINRVDIGPLAKSSFEETNDMIIKAGIFSELDKINGVSANIMIGQIPEAGTGMTDILIDEGKLLGNIVPQPKELEPEINPDDICTNICVGYSLPKATKKQKKKQTVKFV